MFGQNKIAPPEHGDGRYLKIHSIFETIQGEGPYTGAPAVFIRLSGCNLACQFCDTEFESYMMLSIEDIIQEVIHLSGNQKKLIVITGGEPFRQPITLLCNKLTEIGMKIQIEANGTLYRSIPKVVEVVCSPKNTGNGYSNIRTDLMAHTIAIKFIISAFNTLYNNIAEVGQSDFNVPVYVQPMDEIDESKNKINVLRTIEIAKQNNAIVSLQMHKIINIA
jgi:7-carboxy-7-deazaguanine synthase